VSWNNEWSGWSNRDVKIKEQKDSVPKNEKEMVQSRKQEVHEQLELQG